MHPYRFFFSSLFVTSVVCCVCSLYFCMYACLFDRIVFVRSSWFCICFLWGGGWLADHLDGVTGYYETRNFLKIRNHHFSHSSPCMNTNSPLPYTHHQSACIHWLRLRDKTPRLRQAPDRSGRWVTDVGCLTHFVAWTFHASAWECRQSEINYFLSPRIPRLNHFHVTSWKPLHVETLCAMEVELRANRHFVAQVCFGTCCGGWNVV